MINTTAILNLLTLVILGVILYQDIKHRAVSWMLFPLLVAVAAVLGFVNVYTWTYITNVGINIMTVLLITGFTFTFILVKNSLQFQSLKRYIGLGDILFFVALSLFFSPVNFVLFFLLSMIFVLLSVTIFVAGKENKNYIIPLAGLQAFLLIIVMVCSMVFNYNLYDDYHIINAIIELYG